MTVAIAVHVVFLWVLGLTMQAKPVDTQQVTPETTSHLTK